jgi:hypothetical protein
MILGGAARGWRRADRPRVRVFRMRNGVHAPPSMRAEARILAAAAALGALALVWLGPPGTDFAAHAYQEALFSAHGFSLWNNMWYSGRYSFITYSTLYYPLAALIGIRLLAVVCVGTAVLAFARITDRRWGAASRWAARSAAVVLPAFVLTAAFPFLLGAALALVALAALQVRRWWGFGILCPLVAAASPLAFVLLAMAVIAIAVGDRWGRPPLVISLSILGAVALLLLLAAALFPSHARYPFPVPALVPAIVFAAGLAAITWRVEAARTLRVLALVFAAACCAAFVVSSQIGEGITRLRFIALPIALLALALRGWRPRGPAIAVALFAAWWNVAPLVTSLANGAGDASQRASYWRPATAFLRAHMSPAYRTEVVDTQRHWPADYFPAAGIPIVRGWFRQDDFPQNRLLYRRFGPASYVRWLRSLGVRYVVLSDAVPDYSAHREAALLRSGRSGLRRVFRAPHLEIFALPSPSAIVSGPGRPRVLGLGRDRVAVRASVAGTYRVAVRYSPYWEPSTGCLSAGADGMLRLRVRGPALVRMRFVVTVPAMLRVLAGRDGTRCAPAGPR